ncbi:hypothetical protein [Gracilibacillus phocaeensis]|uniref:hypothetical protein n=1 Tax=Gracilibacillus phocaeensis TaxID=2042304 RepID=UPI001031CF70|nr:hypothetical protein [Gracilibacillus phocaeensis]
MDYLQTDGEMGFYTRTEKTDPKKEDELTWYEHIDIYVLHGYTFTHGYDDQEMDTGNVQGMKVVIPEPKYEVIIHAGILTKEEMEKILLSMVE